MIKYKVWECKIVVPNDTELPNGFDCVPRHGAIDAINKHNIDVLDCFSGWGGKLTKTEQECVVRDQS